MIVAPDSTRPGSLGVAKFSNLPDFSRSAFADLLERSGFRIRGRTRADCPRCADGHGHGLATVSFTDEVFYCHRCGYAGNARTLSRSLGITISPETREHRERRQRAKRFSIWLNTCHAILTGRLTFLRERATVAGSFLNQFPDDDDAWDVLADLYHERASLFGALDLLACDPLSIWLGQPMTREKLAALFEQAEKKLEAGDGK